MKFEVLRKNYLKRNIVIGVVIVLIISTVILQFTKAKYRTAQSMPLYRATVNYSQSDLNIIAMYQESDTGEYTSSDTVPTSGYSLNKEQSYCEVDGVEDNTIPISYENGRVNISINKKGTKCYLYFDKTLLKNTLIANYSTVLTRSNFNVVAENTTTDTIYKSLDTSQYDNDGEVYYFAGNPTDNWVYFAGYYWRIIRINGSGTVRLIYQGKTNDMSGEGIYIGTSTFNNYNGGSERVGYIYTLGEQRGNSTDSEIKKYLDNWYIQNLSDFQNYIAENEGFCGDREMASGYSWSSQPSSYIYNAAYDRLVNNKQPSFKCTNEDDLYTVSTSNKGNNLLAYPIGLITADEAEYAGSKYYTSSNSFLNTDDNTYYTITPHSSSKSQTRVFTISGALLNGESGVTDSFGIRPVSNLRADVTILRGTGSQTDPFVITE